MKKVLTFILLATLPIFLTACTIRNPFAKIIDKAVNVSQNRQNSGAINQSGENLKTSIFDLMKRNIPVKCSFEGDSGGFGGKGVVYVSGEKSRSEFEATVEGKTSEIVMIIDEDWVYYWSPSDKSNPGMKFKLDQEAKSDVKSSMDKLRTEANYRCSPWIIDYSKFSVPSDVTFVDLEESLKQMRESFGGTNSGVGKAFCDSCNDMEDADQKAQCLKSFGCE